MSIITSEFGAILFNSFIIAALLRKVTSSERTIFTLCFVASKAQKVYEFNSTCQQAYKEITQMKLANGIALIEKAKQQNSNNLIPILLENYVDFIVLFFNEDSNEFQKRYNKFDERIELLKQGPQTSPFYNFCLGTAYLQKAGVNLKFDNKSRAGWEFQIGYRYIKQNKKSFPTFTPNDIFSGSIQAVVGSIPKGFKWVANLFGVKGNLKEGMQVVTNFINSSDPWARLMNTEATFIYCYLNFYLENKKEETIQFIQRKKIDLINNHLLAYMTASLAMNSKQNELCKSIVLNRNKSADYFQTPIWDFQLGYAYLHQLQIPDAIVHFEKYLKQQDIDNTFNVYHTWIEYINRLLGALLGIFILIHAVWSFRKFFYTKRSVFLWSLGLVVAVGFQGWLGKKVVDANLAVVKITTHMLVALLIAAIPVYIIYLVREREKVKHATLKKLTSLALILLVLQIVLGTEVREQIDIVAKSLNYTQRELWIDRLDIFFKIHRSFSLVIFAAVVGIFLKSKMITQLSKVALLNLILVGVLIFLGVVMNYVHIPAIAQPLHLLFSSILIINLFAFRLKLQ